MRTTVQFEADTARAVADLVRERGQGVSAAVNELVRRGLLAAEPARRYVPRTQRLGLKVDVSDVANALDVIEGPDQR